MAYKIDVKYMISPFRVEFFLRGRKVCGTHPRGDTNPLPVAYNLFVVLLTRWFHHA